MMRGRIAGRVLVSVLMALGVVTVSIAAAANGDVKPVTVTIVHLNDVYEIVPVEGGKAGGLARVATVLRDLKARQGPVVTTLGGDYLSPSALGTAKVDGKPLAGRQMVDVLNAVGVDWATFGNHEFDVSEAAFRAHLEQAKFGLVSSNVLAADGQPFPGVATSAIVPPETQESGLPAIGYPIGATTILSPGPGSAWSGPAAAASIWPMPCSSMPGAVFT